MRVPITKPFFGAEEFEAVRRPLESGWVVQGPYVKAFEDAFAAFVGAPYAAAASSCTTALHLAIAALRVKPGDEVIVPAFTWVATPNVVEYMGATPVFCDIDRGTFNLDVAQVPSLVTSRTVGIIPVHLFGLCADMDAVRRVAERHHLWIVEDAACAFGASIRGRHAGTFGDFGCFSFHPRKAITTGEGGMVTSDRADRHHLVCSLRDHGASRSDFARHTSDAAFLLSEYSQLGFNYRMTDIQGALGCAQMERAEWVLAERARAACWYDSNLKQFDWLKTPRTPDGFKHGYQSYVCWFEPESITPASVERVSQRRNSVMAAAERHGVATRQGTHAPVLTPFYAGKYALRPEQYPHAWMADRLTISLPMYPQITNAELEFVVDTLARAADE